MADLLSASERAQLLALARSAIATGLAGESPALPEAGGALCARRGAFVSLHRRSPRELRGCIGYIEPTLPLVEVIVRAAQAAAFHDPRFPPLRAEELPSMQIEISVLTIPGPIRPEDIEVGTHGLIAERGARRGLLLPQVATELGWDRETFLQHTCLKAGLPPDAWRDPETLVLAFSAEVFAEA